MLNTKRLYLVNSELFEIEATILKINSDETGRWIILSETVYHPKGGGQKSDIGVIDVGSNVSFNVLSGIEIDGQVRHYIDETQASLPQVGQTVRLSIDSKHRKLGTLFHTAGHLLAAIAMEEFPDLSPIKGNSYPGEATYVFNLPEGIKQLSKEKIIEILQTRLAEKIAEKLSIHQLITPEGIRHIQIEKYKAEPCGGTHLNCTSEIGKITIRSIKIKNSTISIGYDAFFVS